MENIHSIEDAKFNRLDKKLKKDKQEKQDLSKEEILYCEENFIPSWIMGYPLLTEYGYIKPIKINEFFKKEIFSSIEFLKLQDWQVKNQILSFVKKTYPDRFDSVKEDFDKFDFMTCVRNNVMGLRTDYTRIFSLFVNQFNPKSLWTMAFSDWDRLRKLILDFNDIYYHEANPNPEIERYNKMKQFLAMKKGGTIEFDAMYSLLMTKEGGGHQPSEINEWTYRQFNSAFKRIQFNKAHEVTTLFKTVDTQNSIEIVEYYKTFREEDNTGQSFESVEDLKKTNAFLGEKK